MRIGIPAEVKNNEYRVAITPAGVHEFVRRGHQVVVQAGAGLGSGIADAEYTAAGATIAPSPDEVWAAGEMIMKVKEPIESEYERMREGQLLFTYLHLAADAALTEVLLAKKVTAIAYETVQTQDGALPLLAPMSEVAGRLAPQLGAHALTRAQGGRGVLLAGVPGVRRGKVLVLGAGVAGINAATIAIGMQADVEIFDLNPARLRAADQLFEGRVTTVMSTAHEIERAAVGADLVIGAVLVPGAKAPELISHDLVAQMHPGSVLVDISIDQGGCFADSRPTTHADPTYLVEQSVFSCVANLPGAVPHTSTRALTNMTLRYAVALAEDGWKAACAADGALALGLNTHGGEVIHEAVAATVGRSARPLAEVLG